MGILSNLRALNHKRLANQRLAAANRYPFTLAVLGMMKNESMNIDEWVSHYLAMGADKIYLIDNGSTDDSVAKARAWADKGLLHLIEMPDQHRQVAHYRAAIRHFRIAETCQWLLIADLDEFWFCPDGSTLPAMLTRFDGIEVIYANWRMFGSSGLIQHPDSIRTSLIHADPKLNAHSNTKYICRTKVLRRGRAVHVHKIAGADSAKTVSDNENFHLNHYAIQSVEYFQKVKMARGDVLTGNWDRLRDMNYFHRYDAPCTMENRALADLVVSGTLGKRTQALP